jgi:hypothetical protein
VSDIWRLPNDRLDLELILLPSIVTWSRLEPMSLSADLLPGLQALTADPLWMIGRQWQFGELRGEDGGTPISTILDIEHAPLSRLRLGARDDDETAEVVDIVDERLPLEARVEAEGVELPADRVRAAAGMQLLRTLADAGLADSRDSVVATWSFASPADENPALPDRTGAGRARVYAGRVPDAARVAADLVPLSDGDGPLTGLPAGFNVGGGQPEEESAREVLATWLRWYQGSLVGAGQAGGPPAWNPHRQEYSFAVQADLPVSGRTVLHAEEYTSGRLDWTDFQAVEGDLGETPAGRGGDPERRPQRRLPTVAAFPGMPADRLWQFEDAKVYLGGIEAGPTDLTRMALVEFSLAYGVDWYVVPIDVSAAAAMRVNSLTVVDTFGAEVSVGPTRQPGGWSMFGLTPSADPSSRADVFVVPPVVTHVLESDPLEEVALFRDEMANLVWGVERVVQAPTGEPVNRSRAAPPISLRQQLPGDLDDARIVYRLMTPVPDHWVPFVAVPVAGAPAGTIELERRPLLHFRADGTTDVTHPRGMLLLTTPDADATTDRLRLAEEEVPRDGVVVTRRYQLARTPDGGTAMWIGRRKRTGDGEGWSGLRFDTALAPGAIDR